MNLLINSFKIKNIFLIKLKLINKIFNLINIIYKCIIHLLKIIYLIFFKQQFLYFFPDPQEQLLLSGCSAFDFKYSFLNSLFVS